MLRRLLQLVQGRSTRHTAELAKTLGVGPELLAQMLEQLVQQGYLQAVVVGCGTPCERCPLHTACLYRRQPKVWALTPRGEALLKEEHDIEQ